MPAATTWATEMAAAVAVVVGDGAIPLIWLTPTTLVRWLLVQRPGRFLLDGLIAPKFIAGRIFTGFI